MESLELVNRDRHATVRMRPADAGDGLFVRVVLSEFPAASAACPLLFSKHPDTGAFYAGAMLGFKPGEYLMDSPDGRPAFRPLEMVREGFFASGEDFVLDRAHPRFAVHDGDWLFDGNGDPTTQLKAAQTALARLMAGSEATDAFIAKLLAHRLIEPIDISLHFDDGERLRLEGLYTVSLDALNELDDAVALDLFRSGDLQCAYAMILSLQHIALMARRRNERLASGV
ncbi:SapC family protein [Sphingobium sp. HBC34]|uniref:SapC family protein n=1 Tax=Sphingobium cyanobacteriorum TaxID=3063954 RepID=A0ABT8ZSG9_9SPHN|nr:SapC family protein [Sphingobium sp. HBC34]MDO7836396.1 SapC family protein [Sphingobium sp. HBC34]